MKDESDKIQYLLDRVRWVRQETLKIHRIAPETRLASSLSDIEVFVSLYYGGILAFKNDDLQWDHRDRFIISKGHGAVSMYPILADLGFFDRGSLSKVCSEGSFLGGIPDTMIPGVETINGSLGQGLGVACGSALALKRKKNGSKVFVLMGDGELYEGSVWEAIMFAGHHKIDNLVLVIDYNKICMLDYCKKVLDLDPLNEKFEAFRWKVDVVDGHDITEVYAGLKKLKDDESSCPKVMIANTVKGKGVPQLEGDSLCHIKSLRSDEIDELIGN